MQEAIPGHKQPHQENSHNVYKKNMKGQEPILQLLLKPSHMNFVDLRGLQELAPCKNHPLSPGPVQVKNPN